MRKKLLAALLVAAFSLSTLSGCGAAKEKEEEKTTASKDAEKEADDEKKEDKKKTGTRGEDTVKANKDDDGVIVAGTVDTSSKFAFEVTNTLIGTDRYDDDIFIVYVIGKFTNNSDEDMDFASIVDIEVKQDGFDLDRAYTASLNKLNYAEIEPGESIPIIMGYEILSGTEDIKVKAIDRTHYAKQVLFEDTFTIDELIENTEDAINEYNDIISDDKNDKLDSL